MNLEVKVPENLVRILDAVSDGMRRGLLSVAGENLHRLVQQHLARIAPARHATADRLGGDRTGHLEKGISGSSFSADETHAEVVIPVAGIRRAFQDVTITPRFANALTLPVHGAAYGHRAAELQRMGWEIFRPKGKNVLMGKREGELFAVPLYVLKKRIQQRQDRSLLPSDEQMNRTVCVAMGNEIARVMRKAS